MADHDPNTGEVQQQSKLVAAVCKVMKAVPFVRATGRNTDQGYGYTSDADLLRPIQAAMADNGLMLHPVETCIEREPHLKTDRNGNQYQAGTKVYLVATYLLRHVSGETITMQSAGCGFDSLDKAVYKAQTGALKYVIRAAFAIPTGDDAERNQPKRRERRGEQSQPPPPPDPEARDKLRKAWHARLRALAQANLTPQLDDDERHAVQLACWGVESISQLSDADCAAHLETLRNTEDAPFAAYIRQTIGADQ